MMTSTLFAMSMDDLARTLASLRRQVHASEIHGPASVDATEWCDDSGRWHLEWLDRDKYPVAARVSIRCRAGGYAAIAIAPWYDYAQHVVEDGEFVLKHCWSSWPSEMLGWMAEIIAISTALGIVIDESFLEPEPRLRPRPVLRRDRSRPARLGVRHA